jgi:hypothetical protein
MLLDSGFNKNMWDEAVCAAAYLIKRSPTSALGEKTPAEMWFVKNQMCQILEFLVQ